MSTFTFTRRDFSTTIMPPLDYTVESYSRSVQGGSKQAAVSATGSRQAIFELIEFLRAPVEIFDEKHDFRWNGYISEVRIDWGGVRYGVSLDTMSNKVAVAYTSGFVRYTTNWSTDTTSATEYGTKEYLDSLSEVSDAKALQLRDTSLASTKYPIPSIRSGQAQEETRKVLILCKGWRDTLDWRYYANDAGLESYEVLGTNAGREIGEDDRPIYAQAFQLTSSTGWNATTIWIRLYKVGSPVDNFQIALKSDSAGDPGTTLASATVGGADVTTSGTWTEFTLSASVALSTSTTYWIHSSRSGAIDTDNYYVIGNNPENGYEGGDPKYYNTNLSAWVDASHKGDQNFRVIGNQSTTEQITTLITQVGEFFTGSQIDDASGVNTFPYRYGDNRALWELEKLLDTGSTNDRRLIYDVTRARLLRVYEEPAAPTEAETSYALNSRGTLFSPYGREVPPSECTVGVWCRLMDVLPASVDVSRISSPDLFFIEEAEYRADTDEYTIVRARNEEDVFVIGGIE